MITGELIPCPLCGHSATEVMKGYSCGCSNTNCVLHEPMDINEWQSRPIEYELHKQLDKSDYVLKDTQLELVSAENKLKCVADILGKISVMDITIILKDGTVINSGELARDGLETIRS